MDGSFQSVIKKYHARTPLATRASIPLRGLILYTEFNENFGPCQFALSGSSINSLYSASIDYRNVHDPLYVISGFTGVDNFIFGNARTYCLNDGQGVVVD